jgi:hypothetical protein
VHGLSVKLLGTDTTTRITTLNTNNTDTFNSEEDFDTHLSDPEPVEKLRVRAIDRYAHRLSTIDVLQLYTKCNINGIYVIGYEKEDDNINK